MSNLTSGGSLDAVKEDIQDLRSQARSFEDQKRLDRQIVLPRLRRLGRQLRPGTPTGPDPSRRISDGSGRGAAIASAHAQVIARRTLAQQTGCRFCASLGRPSPDHATRRESLAVAFADAVGSDHTAISDAQVRVLFDEFTIPEIVELLIWISFEYAGQLFGCLIADESATEEEKHAFAASIAELAPAHADSKPPTTPRHGEV